MLKPGAMAVLMGLAGLFALPAHAQEPGGANDAGSRFQMFEDDGPEVAPDRRTYRTVCVRLCDGYFFPISFAVPSSALDRDARQCSARCGDQARLFFYANPGEPLVAARDFTGMQYAALPNAFKYRQRLVDGCQCTPKSIEEQTSARSGRELAAQEEERSARDQREGERGAQAPEPLTQDDLMRPAEGSHTQPLPFARKDRRADSGTMALAQPSARVAQ